MSESASAIEILNNDNKKFEKLEDALNETKQRLGILKVLLDEATLITDESRNIVWKISRCYFDWADWRQEISYLLWEENYPEIAMKIIKRLFDIGPAVDDATYKFSLNILTSLWSFSKFDTISKAVVSEGAIPLFLDYLTNAHIFLEHIATKKPPEQFPMSKWAILKVVLNIVHEFAKQPELAEKLCSSKAVDVLQMFIEVDNKAVHFTMACCLAYLTCGNVLQPNFDSLFNTINYGIEQILADDDRTNYHGLELLEIAESLYLLAAKSNNFIDADDERNQELLAKLYQNVAEFIVGEDEILEKCGNLLFYAYCRSSADNSSWVQALEKIVQEGSDSSSNDRKKQAKAVKAANFLKENEDWLDQQNAKARCQGFKTKENDEITTLEEAIGETEMRIKFLAKLAELTPNQLFTFEVNLALSYLCDSYNEFDTAWRADFVSVIVREEFPVIAAKYLSFFQCTGLSQTYNCSLPLIGLLWNVTDFSPQFRLDLAKASVLKMLLDHLVEANKTSAEKRTGRENYLIFVIVNTVYNMSRSIELKSEFLQLNAADILKEYVNMSELIKSIVILCLAHILSDTPEATKLAHEQGVVPHVVRYCNMAMIRPDRICMMQVTVGGMITSVAYSLEELVEGLALLAVNDAIKEDLIKNNVCEIISFLLKSGASNLEDLGIDLLWTLSFEPSARNEILTSKEKLIDSLRLLANNSSESTTTEVQQHASKALTFIEKWENKVAEAEATSEDSGRRSVVTAKQGHIFLSYSWKQQSTVRKIKQELLKHNYTVWMDVDKMHGDLLEAMAAAIEQASVILICFSNSYKQSNPCRTEAQYAHALCKPIIPVNMEYHYFPDGWLGILVRSRKFVDMSLEKRSFEDAFEQLLSELRVFGPDDSSLPLSEIVPSSSSEPLGGGHSAAPPRYPSPLLLSETASKKLSYKNWTTDDVQRWLDREKMTEFAATLRDFNGEMLATFYAIKTTAPDFYYKTVSKHYNGSLQGLLKLLGALDRLWLE